MPTLFAIRGVEVSISDDGRNLSWIGPGNIDGDGAGPSYGDPCFQPDTTLHHDGKPLDSSKVPGIVVPRAVIDAVDPVVMGCQGWITYNGETIAAVVYDEGPPDKLGEISEAAAGELGIPNSPTEGGVDSGVSIWIEPGVPALVNGIQYRLQPT